MYSLVGADRPFGPLTPVHQYIVQHSVQLSAENWWKLVIVPLSPLGAQCLLMLYPGTRPYRIILGVIGISLLLHASASYRFVGVEYNALNVGIAVGTLHLVGRYTELALLSKPIVDPYVAKGRWKLVAAIDLAINSRMIGLGSIAAGDDGHKKTSNNPPKPANGHAVTSEKDGKVQLKDHSLPSRSQAYLPRPKRPLGYGGTLLRHALEFLKHYALMDTMIWLATYFRDATGIRVAHRGALAEIIRDHQWMLFPGLSFEIEAPKLVVWVLAELLVFIATTHGLQTGYHIIAMIAVGSGIWEPQAWDVYLFDGEPLAAQSLLELWGRRWHQLFRHHFLLLSAIIFRAVGLRPNHPLLHPLVFLFSGILHGLGGITMDPPPDPIQLVLFFSLSGVGCALEVVFRKITGRRVRGWAGTVWVWVWMLGSAGMLCEGYVDACVGMSSLSPDLFITPGQYIGGFIKTWLVDIKR